jgi:hypothetical protein
MGRSSSKTAGESNPMRVLTVKLMLTASRSAPRIESMRCGSIHDGGGAAEIQVHRDNGVVLKLLRRADERRDVIADHLRDDGPAGGVLGDGTEDVLLDVRGRMNAKVFRVVNVRATVGRHQFPKRQVRHVLHRREGEQRLGTAQQGGELFVVAHAAAAVGFRINHRPRNVSRPFSISSSKPIL